MDTSLSCFGNQEENGMRCGLFELLVLIVTMLLIGLTRSFATADCGDGMGGGGQSGIGDYRYSDGWRLGHVETKKIYSYDNICKCSKCTWKVTGRGFSIGQTGELEVKDNACGEFMITAICDKGQTYVAGSVGSWPFNPIMCSNGSSSCNGETPTTNIVYYGDIKTLTYGLCGNSYIPLPSCPPYTAEIPGNPCATVSLPDTFGSR